jgi:aryl-alcohol dehydrogenase-like predicted oxidoreductase
MKYRQLGYTGLRVSELALGTMTFGGQGKFAYVGTTEVEEARRIVDVAIDRGINFIDTADIYSAGRSEEILGEVLTGRRDEIVLATKARFAMGTGQNDAGLSRRYLIRACEASLRRLKTDYIDLYQVHQRDGITPMEETLDALDTLVHQGKVRYIGVSNHSAWHVMKALGISERRGLQRYVTQQVYYSLLDRDVEYELVPLSIEEKMGILVWSPLAGGLLSGKIRRGVEPPAGSRMTTEWGEPPVYNKERMYNIIEALIGVAEGRGVSPAQVALAYLLGKPAVSAVILGARNEEQLLDNIGAVELMLSETERATLDTVSAMPLIYPYWHQAASASERLSEADESLLAPFHN